MRSLRLFALLDHLRGRSRPVSADALADAFDVSTRTIYRDIATLQAMGAPLRGAAGLGYQLERGYFLPPLHFDPDEMDAIMLGMRLIAARGDVALGAAAHRVSGKLGASMNPAKAAVYQRLPLRAVTQASQERERSNRHLPMLRSAIRQRLLLELAYRDQARRDSQRVVRPLGLTLFDSVWLLTTWCHTRADFRNFRVDRILSVHNNGATFVHERGKRFEDYLRTL